MNGCKTPFLFPSPAAPKALRVPLCKKFSRTQNLEPRIQNLEPRTQEVFIKTYIHKTALVETDQVGADTKIWAFAHVMAGVEIGADCNVGDHTFIETGATIGNGVTIKNNALIWKGVQIGDYAFIGPNVVFTNDRRPRSPRMPLMKQKNLSERDWLVETFVEEGASIGANATILPGIRLGRYCMVGAGSVVTKDVPSFTLVVGNPARPVGKVDEEGNVVA